MPWLLAAAKPRFSALRISRTSGRSAAMRATLSSLEPLSTTVTSNEIAARAACSERRQSSVRPAVFQLTITIERSTGTASWSLDEGEARHRHDEPPAAHQVFLLARLELLDEVPRQDQEEVRLRR